MIKAIIFDMDGVVVDSEPIYIESFNKVMKIFGISVNKNEYLREFAGKGTMYIVKENFKRHKIRPKQGFVYWNNKWKTEYQRLIKKGIKPIPGFLSFNRKIDKAGLKKIIATGSPRKNTYIALRHLGIAQEFKNRIVSAEDVKKRKPSPDLFLRAAKKINEEPQCCLVFEDSIPGIEAAKRAGMKCIALTTSLPRSRIVKAKPNMIVNNFMKMRIEDIVDL